MTADTRAASVHLAEHYATLEAQSHAARMGMWIFLGTEILLFGGLFVGYTMYRFLFHESFHEASRHLNTALGTVDTVVLLTSSLTAVLSVHYLRGGKLTLMMVMILATMALGLGFLCIHGY